MTVDELIEKLMGARRRLGGDTVVMAEVNGKRALNVKIRHMSGKETDGLGNVFRIGDEE